MALLKRYNKKSICTFLSCASSIITKLNSSNKGSFNNFATIVPSVAYNNLVSLPCLSLGEPLYL